MKVKNVEKHALSSPLSTPHRGKRIRRLCIINSRSSSVDDARDAEIFRRFGSPTHPANIEIRLMEMEKAAARLAKAKDGITVESSSPTMPGTYLVYYLSPT